MDILVAATLAALEVCAFKAVTIRKQDGYSTAWTIWACFVAHYALFKWYRIFVYPKYHSPLRHLPGPKDNHPFFGQAINLFRAETPTSLYLQWMREHPTAPLIRYLSFANREILVVNSLQSHKDLLQSHCYSFRKPASLRRILKAIAGDGIFMLEGQRHQAHRKILNTYFSRGKLHKLGPTFQHMAKEVVHSLERLIPSQDHNQNVTLDCIDLFSRATLDIIAVTTLGIELSSLRRPEASQLDGVGIYSTHAWTFHEAYAAIFTQDLVGRVLMWADGFLPIRWIPLEANSRFLSATAWLTQTLIGIVRERYRNHRDVKSHDLLTSLVKESAAGGPAKRLSEDDVVGHLLQIMVAGHETSAMMLSWAVYIMATKQNIQIAVYAEISELLRQRPSPTLTDIDKLAYLNYFVMETLRVYSPATTTCRQAEADVTLDGVWIPRGTAIDMIPSVAMLNPTIWGEDAEAVDPTRWGRLVGDQHSAYAFEAFSNGPRICIGRGFALREIKAILFEMVRAFQFLEVVEPFKIENPGLTLRPAGLRVLCRKR
ncbi:cytochrome P450 [Xylariaceae sp. FL0255]|nr:cytochrome P450 [Xylariaceae sp. FL0255]